MNSPHSSNPTKKDSWFRNLSSINITLLVKLSLFMEKIIIILINLANKKNLTFMNIVEKLRFQNPKRLLDIWGHDVRTLSLLHYNLEFFQEMTC